MAMEDIPAANNPSGRRDFPSSSPTNTRVMESPHARIESFITSVLPTSTKRALLAKEPPEKYGKVIAVSQWGRKRDFVDLFWYATHCEPLTDVLRRLPAQYPEVAHDYHHILKSLVYFVDAESDPMPNMLSSVSWKDVKKFFEREVRTAVRELIL